MLGEGATAADISALRHAYGFDAPLSQQYAHYWRGILHGDLGQSLRLHDSVTHLVLQRYPYTLALTLAALLIGIAFSVPAGVCPRCIPTAGRTAPSASSRWSASRFPTSRSAPSSFSSSRSTSAGCPSLPQEPEASATSCSTSFFRRSPSALASRPSSPAWSAPRCSKSWGRTTSAPPAPRASARTRIVYRHALRNALIPVLTVIGLQFG